jgi:hypothetical protein
VGCVGRVKIGEQKVMKMTLIGNNPVRAHEGKPAMRGVQEALSTAPAKSEATIL